MPCFCTYNSLNVIKYYGFSDVTPYCFVKTIGTLRPCGYPHEHVLICCLNFVVNMRVVYNFIVHVFFFTTSQCYSSGGAYLQETYTY